MIQLYNPVLLAVLLSVFQLCTTQLLPYQQKALEVNNQYRAIHHAPALTSDLEISTVASRCLQHYLYVNSTGRSCSYDRVKYYELTYDAYYLGPGNVERPSDEDFAKTTMDTWYSDGKDYNYEKGFTGNQFELHFTQMLWISTKKLGFAIGKRGNRTLALGIYSPSGNIVGEYQKNVLKP